MDDGRRSKWKERKTAPGGTPSSVGREAEDLACRLLRRHGLQILERNYRVARGPSRRGGEIDLIARDPDGTLVFVEVRARRGGAGRAAGSVDGSKRARIVLAARVYLCGLPRVPPCRFDVVAVDEGDVHWLRAAFDSD